MKKLLSSLLIIFVLLGGSGCMSESINYQEQALNHLEEKYNETFEVISYIPKSIDVSYDEVICKNASGETARVLIYDSDNEYKIHDDYYGTLKKHEYKKLLSESFPEIMGEYKHFVSFRSGHFDNTYTEKTPISDAIKEKPMQFYSNNYIFINESTAAHLTKANFDEMCEKIKSQGITLYIAVYVVPDSDFAEIDESSSVNAYLSADISQEPLFKAVVK